MKFSGVTILQWVDPITEFPAIDFCMPYSSASLMRCVWFIVAGLQPLQRTHKRPTQD